MKFQVASFRGAHRLMGEPALREVCAALRDVSFQEVLARWQDSKAVGMQPILNEVIEEQLLRRGWTPQVPVFDADEGTKKGFWTMDFRKEFKPFPDERVGIEVMFNHAEAMVWTMSRLDLANEAENVKPGSRIDAGVVIVASDALKQHTIRKTRDGKVVTKDGAPRDFKIDSAVGTYERLRTIVPKVRNFVKVPLLICTLYPEEGGIHGGLELITLDSDRVMVEGEWQGTWVDWDDVGIKLL